MNEKENKNVMMYVFCVGLMLSNYVCVSASRTIKRNTVYLCLGRINVCVCLRGSKIMSIYERVGKQTRTKRCENAEF